MEYFRLSLFGQLKETQFQLLRHAESYALPKSNPWSDDEQFGVEDPNYGAYGSGTYSSGQGWLEDPRADAPHQPPRDALRRWWEEDLPFRPRRIDPDYFWGHEGAYR